MTTRRQTDPALAIAVEAIRFVREHGHIQDQTADRITLSVCPACKACELCCGERMVDPGLADDWIRVHAIALDAEELDDE